jgi:hypothetical protein
MDASIYYFNDVNKSIMDARRILEVFFAQQRR